MTWMTLSSVNTNTISMAPDRMQLQGMSMNERESFKEYTQRWRELVA